MIKIDAHHHFWRFNQAEYSWIDERMKSLRRDFLPADLEPQLSVAGYSGSVVVQARQTVEETRWLLTLSTKYNFIKGVVGWLDLCNKDELKRQLDVFSKSGKFVGVRHVVHDEPDDSFMLRDEFLQGISILKDYNLTYDLLLFPKHLPVAQMLVSMFPEQKFVLDHIGKPLINEKITDPWKEDLITLGNNSNVWCKLSGMVTEADWQNQKPEDFNQYLDIVFSVFGPERLMIGSDWPVSLLAGKYQNVMDITENYISGMPDEIRRKIAGENCVEFYGLNGV